ncbi:hypothetical protein LguiA_021362 [Lonicera macranthoides]
MYEDLMELKNSIRNTLSIECGELSHARLQNFESRWWISADHYSHASERKKIAIDNRVSSLIGRNYKVGQDIRITGNRPFDNGETSYEEEEKLKEGLFGSHIYETLVLEGFSPSVRKKGFNSSILSGRNALDMEPKGFVLFSISKCKGVRSESPARFYGKTLVGYTDKSLKMPYSLVIGQVCKHILACHRVTVPLVSHLRSSPARLSAPKQAAVDAALSLVEGALFGGQSQDMSAIVNKVYDILKVTRTGDYKKSIGERRSKRLQDLSPTVSTPGRAKAPPRKKSKNVIPIGTWVEHRTPTGPAESRADPAPDKVFNSNSVKSK